MYTYNINVAIVVVCYVYKVGSPLVFSIFIFCCLFMAGFLVLIRPSRSLPSCVVNRRSTSIKVSWQEVQDAERYNVVFSQIFGKNQRGVCREVSRRNMSVITSNLSVTLEMLRPFTTYSVIVLAENNVSHSSLACSKNATTMPTSEFNSLNM